MQVRDAAARFPEQFLLSGPAEHLQNLPASCYKPDHHFRTCCLVSPHCEGTHYAAPQPGSYPAQTKHRI